MLVKTGQETAGGHGDDVDMLTAGAGSPPRFAAAALVGAVTALRASEDNDTMQGTGDKRVVSVTLATLLAVLAVNASIHALAWVPDTDISLDSYYHVGMADLFPRAGLLREFPWTQRSIWRTHFADKEWAFHAFLASVRRWAGMLGYSGAQGPFWLEAHALLLLWFGLFIAALYRLDLRDANWTLPAVLLLCPYFTLRMNMVRPQVLSVALLVLTSALLASAEAPCSCRFLALMAALGAVFAYCHSNPHFILLPTVCFAAARGRAVRWKHALPSAAAAVGVFLGLLIHPQTPNTFLIWKIQCVDVVLQLATGGIQDVESPLEFAGADVGCLLENAAVFIAAAVLAVLMWRGRAARRQPRHDERQLALEAAVCCAGVLLSRRLLEYAVPLTVLAMAVVLSRRPQLWTARRRCAACFAALALGAALMPRHVAKFSNARHPPPREFVGWARSNLTPGTYIANLNWDDFPKLFFLAPEFRYAYGLDPMFAYAAMGSDYQRIERWGRRLEPFPPPEYLHELLGTRLVFLSRAHMRTAKAMAEARYPLVYAGPDGWCFDLAGDPPPPD